MYKIFKRKVWIRNPSWPEGYEPLAVPMNKCRTIHQVNTEDEARRICREENGAWRKHYDRVNDGTASAAQRKTYYEADRYEYTEL